MNRVAFKNFRGVGLIEVLVTMLLLSTALLTLAALQTRSLQYNQGAYFRSQANALSYDVLDRIRVNKVNLANYNVSLAPFSGTAPTTPLSAVDIYQWRKDIDTRLPQGQGGITCNATTSLCTITIKWGELNSSGQADEDYTTFTFESRI